MDYRFGAMVVQRLAQLVRVEQISLEKARAFDHRVTMSLREIVVHHHFVAIVYQLFANNTSDVSGAAGYENLHNVS
jgi:hypothetical protein